MLLCARVSGLEAISRFGLYFAVVSIILTAFIPCFGGGAMSPGKGGIQNPFVILSTWQTAYKFVQSAICYYYPTFERILPENFTEKTIICQPPILKQVT
jgi:hypothetical protein